MGGEGIRERFQPVWEDRQAGGGTVAAESLEVDGARGEARMQIEARHRPPRALPALPLAGDQYDRTAEPLHEPRGDDPDHPLVPALTPDDVGAAAALLGRPAVDNRDGLAHDLLLDRLTVAVQRLELVREQICFARVIGENEMQCDVGPPQAPGRVDPGGQPERDCGCVDGGGVDTGHAHQGAEPGFLGARETPEADRRECTVLVDERDDIGDRGEGDEIGMAGEHRVVDAEERLRELDDHTGPAQLRKGIDGGPRGDDRALRQRLRRAMVVGDDHVDTEPAGILDLCGGGDAAVHREEKLHAFLREPRDRRRGDAVAFLEPAREVPDDVGSELSQRQRRERRSADAVDVVVAVDADPLSPLDGRAQPRDSRRHVPEQQGIVRDALGLEERARRVGIAQPSPHEHARNGLGDVELRHEGCDLGERHGLDLPASDHAATIGPAPDGG